jgi:ectoine hydroxylase-related dioxygenase (phytanoyl-CoA dioxygenase family)
MLFLFSDVGPEDAPTRLLPGSHGDIARSLAAAGQAGRTLRQLVRTIEDMEPRGEAMAVGEAGTVYLCHPFLVHAAQPNRGRNARFMAQPPLLPRTSLKLDRDDGAYSPVEQAIRLAIGLAE